MHEVYTGTERGVLTIQEYVLNQVLTYVLSKLYCTSCKHYYKLHLDLSCAWLDSHIEGNIMQSKFMLMRLDCTNRICQLVL